MKILTKKEKEKITKFINENVIPNKENLISLTLKISNLKIGKKQKLELMGMANKALFTNGKVEGFMSTMKDLI